MNSNHYSAQHYHDEDNHSKKINEDIESHPKYSPLDNKSSSGYRHHYPVPDDHDQTKSLGYNLHQQLEVLLDKQDKRRSYYQQAKDDVTDHLAIQRHQQLLDNHNHLKGLVKAKLIHAQKHLYHAGYSTNIQEQKTTDTTGDNNNHYWTSLSLHMHDITVAQGEKPSKKMSSSNRIRFYGVAQSGDLECQFSTSKMQSKILSIAFKDHNYSSAHTVVDSLISDFIAMVLLSQRVGASFLG